MTKFQKNVIKAMKIILLINKKNKAMANNELLPLNVEWENGVISNELQEGVKPKFIIIGEHTKIAFEDAKKLMEAPKEEMTLVLQAPKDAPSAPQDFLSNLGVLVSTLEGLGVEAPICNYFSWSSVEFNSDWSSMSMVLKLRI